jgi:hypothetical protein
MRVAEVQRDERTEQVENVGFRISYGFLMFGVLIAGTYRGYVLHQQTWDLLGLVMGASAISLAYKAVHRAFPRSLLWVIALSAIAGALMAVTYSFARR